jgi:hypothetical protein
LGGGGGGKLPPLPPLDETLMDTINMFFGIGRYLHDLEDLRAQ